MEQLNGSNKCNIYQKRRIKMGKSQEQEYGADQIQILEGLEAVSK